MQSPIAHFDVPADDVERARRFYERVFGWRFEAWGPPDFYLIQTGATPGDGIHGSLSQRPRASAPGAPRGYECTISVSDLDAIRRAIVANGGKIVQGEHEIVGVGRLIRFEDSEGNLVCAMHYQEES